MSLLQFAGLVIAVTFILYAAWRIGFEDGKRLTREEGAMTIQRIINEPDNIVKLAEEHDFDRHVVTYADLAAFEEKQNNK